jgi:1-acyl-sn-glycerol-3-phosphate acyltransferase
MLYRPLAAVLRPLIRLLYRVGGSGWERIPAHGPAVLAANHDSVLDGFVMGMLTRRVIHWMAKAELWGYPLVGRIMEALGAFRVERGASDELAMAHGIEWLKRGELVGIFPQGTCLPYRERPFRRGAARLALAAGAPIVPIALINTERAIRPGKIKLGFPKVLAVVGDPLQPEGTVEELTTRLEAAVEDLRKPYGPPAHAWFASKGN